jgi:ankyrin repeat protein
LHNASINGHIEFVKYLIEQCRANVEAKNIYGKTPLHDASNYGHIEIVEYLVEQCHANIEAKDNDGRAPFQVSFGIIREYLRF